MKKLLKSEICGSINSALCALIGWKLFCKSNFAATVHAQYMNSSRNSKICPKTREKKKKKHKRKRKRISWTQTDTKFKKTTPRVISDLEKHLYSWIIKKK